MGIFWAGQLAAAAVALIVGGIWYGPLFGKLWMKESGVSYEQMKEKGLPRPIIYGLAFAFAFLASWGLKIWVIDVHSWFESVSEHPFFHGAWHSLKMAFTFGAIPVLVTNSLFDLRSWKYILVNVGYWLLTFTLMGGVLEIMHYWLN